MKRKPHPQQQEHLPKWIKVDVDDVASSDDFVVLGLNQGLILDGGGNGDVGDG